MGLRALANSETLRPLRSALTVTVVLLLVGHGTLSICGKAAFVDNLESVMRDRSADSLPVLGWFELALAAAVALRQSVPLLIFVAMWKLATERSSSQGARPCGNGSSAAGASQRP